MTKKFNLLFKMLKNRVFYHKKYTKNQKRIYNIYM